MVAADLGLTGVYEPHTVTITWKRGAKRTERHAIKLESTIKDSFNKTESGIDCASVTFLRFYKQ